MLEKIYFKQDSIQGLRQGVLGNYIDDFALYLYELGYSTKNLRFRLTIIRILSTWLAENHLKLFDVNEEQLNRFIKFRKKQVTTFYQKGNGKTLSYLVDYLRQKKAIPQSRPDKSINKSIEKITQAYTKYLDEDKGLCASTIKKNKKIIFDFLLKLFGKTKFNSQKITQNTILTHIRKFKKYHELKNIRVMVSAIRSFLRYLVMIGKLKNEIANCIPVMPSWRAAILPVFLVKSETKQLLKACDRHTPNGQRNYAILLLLLRLGLRASEVINLTLDNINWDSGELDICGKGRKHRILPLLPDVGNALALYIRHARPKCLERQVFIRARAPYKRLRNSADISTIVHRALIAAKLNPPQQGAHLLRYTAAMETMSNGATLFEIGELLGHSSVDTTAIYTKIDVVSLRELAQPWPVK